MFIKYSHIICSGWEDSVYAYRAYKHGGASRRMFGGIGYDCGLCISINGEPSSRLNYTW